MRNLNLVFQSLSRDSGRLNFRASNPRGETYFKFQSLSRDSGRLNYVRTALPALGQLVLGFNPSVGIRGV